MPDTFVKLAVLAALENAQREKTLLKKNENADDCCRWTMHAAC